MLWIPKTEVKNLAWDSLRITESWSQLQCQERVFDTEKGVEQAVVIFFLCQGLRQHYGGVSSQISSITWKKDLLKMYYCTFFFIEKGRFSMQKNSCSFSIEGTWLATSIFTTTSQVEASQALIEKTLWIWTVSFSIWTWTCFSGLIFLILKIKEVNHKYKRHYVSIIDHSYVTYTLSFGGNICCFIFFQPEK